MLRVLNEKSSTEMSMANLDHQMKSLRTVTFSIHLSNLQKLQSWTTHGIFFTLLEESGPAPNSYQYDPKQMPKNCKYFEDCQSYKFTIVGGKIVLQI